MRPVGQDAARDGGGATAAVDGTMRAVVQDTYGSCDVLHVADIAVPQVADDDVLITIRAAGVHIGDWHMMAGQPYLMRISGFGLRAPKARVRGLDVAGTVEAVGANVTRFKAGDEVFGTCDGSFAQQATAREHTLALKPANLTFEQAAAVPTSACTALRALHAAGDLTSGQKVLVVGASGGVGLFLVQLAKSSGADVTGVCSTAKVEMVRSVGADRVIDYTQEEVTLSGRQYDVVLDLGGTRSLSQLRRILTPRGTLVLVGGEGGGHLIGGAMVRSMLAVTLSPFMRQRLRVVVATTTAADLQILTSLIEAGKVVPVIDRTYLLGGVPDAIRYLIEGHARGKLVITV